MAHTLRFEQAGINPDIAILHDNDTFAVQWNAQNLGPGDAPAFIDRLVISEIPEGCPGSDDQEHPTVYDSTTDGDPADFEEPELPDQTTGPLMPPVVGPFAAGAYRLTVTMDEGGPNPVTSFNCVDIIQAT